MKFHARIKDSVLSYLTAMLQGDVTQVYADILICGMCDRHVLADPALQIALLDLRKLKWTESPTSYRICHRSLQDLV
jgi:hypothetical protein